MAEQAGGEWVLVVDFCQPLSGVEVDEQAGQIRIPWATLRSMLLAVERFRLDFKAPDRLVPGEVISAPQDDPDRAEIIAARQRAADFGIP